MSIIDYGYEGYEDYAEYDDTFYLREKYPFLFTELCTMSEFFELMNNIQILRGPNYTARHRFKSEEDKKQFYKKLDRIKIRLLK